MALRYDFDIKYLLPREMADRLEAGRQAGEPGLTFRARAARIALFRDAATIAALRAAPRAVQDYLTASGFGRVRYSTGAPPGHFPAGDAAARADIRARLEENRSRFPLPHPGSYPEAGEIFRLGEFLAALYEARPLPLDPAADPAPAAARKHPGPSGAR